MKYNQYSFETIKKLINIGKKYANKYNDIDELIYNTDYDSSQLDFIAIGFANPDFEPELIVPLNWAEKTRIRTRAGLEKVVKKVGM